MRLMPPSVVNDLLPLLRQFSQGDYGVALGGARAKGLADADSDVDIYLFAHQVRSADERARLCRDFSPAVSSVTGWGANDTPFVQGGTDFYYLGRKIECCALARSSGGDAARLQRTHRTPAAARFRRS